MFTRVSFIILPRSKQIWIKLVENLLHGGGGSSKVFIVTRIYSNNMHQVLHIWIPIFNFLFRISSLFVFVRWLRTNIFLIFIFGKLSVYEYIQYSYSVIFPFTNIFVFVFCQEFDIHVTLSITQTWYLDFWGRKTTLKMKHCWEKYDISKF